MKDEDSMQDSTNLKGIYARYRKLSRKTHDAAQWAYQNLSSVVGEIGNASRRTTQPQKGGVRSSQRPRQRSLRRAGRRNNVIAPGFIDTDMTAVLKDSIREKLVESILGSLGKPEHVADAVLFLVSDRPSYITGQTLNVLTVAWLCSIQSIH